MSNNRNPASILYDSYGNHIAILEGYNILSTSPGYPIVGKKSDNSASFFNVSNDGYLQTKTEITESLPDGYNTIGNIVISNYNHSKFVTVIDDVSESNNKRLLVEADFKPGAVLSVSSGVTANTGTIVRRLRNSLSSYDMVVNGSVTPVNFYFNSDPTNDIQLTSLRLVFSSSAIAFTGSSFGKGGGELPNGVTLQIVANGGIYSETLSTLNVNEDFLRLLEFSISQSGSTDVMAASVIFGGKIILEAGTIDNISVTIHDNLTVGARGIYYFTSTIYGIKLLE